MKRFLYSLTGFCWGIFIFNHEILLYTLFVSLLTVIVDVALEDK